MDGTQPSLPMVPRRAGTMTHDYERNGTTDLFAAMYIATGEVLTHCQKGHTGNDVLRFFKQIDASVPRGLAVHVITGNLSAHKTPEITKWLAYRDRRHRNSPTRPRHTKPPDQFKDIPLVVSLEDGRSVCGTLHRTAAFLRRGGRVVGVAYSNDLTVPGVRLPQ